MGLERLPLLRAENALIHALAQTTTTTHEVVKASLASCLSTSAESESLTSIFLRWRRKKRFGSECVSAADFCQQFFNDLPTNWGVILGTWPTNLGIMAAGAENGDGPQLSELESLQLKANKITDESLESTRRMINLCEEVRPNSALSCSWFD